MAASVFYKYARAFADVAADAGVEASIEEEAGQFQDLLGQHRELHETLLNPALPFSAKRTIVEQVSALLALSPATRNFILVLLKNGRMSSYADALAALQQVMDERRGVIRGQVHSSLPISDSLRQRIEDAISGVAGNRVHLDYHQDESLIGGLKVQIGSTIYDGSIQTQLEELRKKLIAQQ